MRERQPFGRQMRQFREVLPGLKLSQLDAVRQSLLAQLERAQRHRLAVLQRDLVRQLGLVVEWLAYRSVEASLSRKLIPVKVRHGSLAEDLQGLDVEILIAGHPVQFDLTISWRSLEYKWGSSRRAPTVVPVKVGADWSCEGLAIHLVRQAIEYLPRDVVARLSAEL